jgi:Tfp pilus assembly protein PilX
MNMNKQKGVVLVVSLVFLIALTAVAAALMQNTTTDMKMSGASDEKTFAEQCAFSAVDNYVSEQINGVDNSLNAAAVTFDEARTIVTALTSTKDRCDIKSATIDLSNNQYKRDGIACPRKKSGAASSEGLINCNYRRIEASIKYGRNKTSAVEVNSGLLKEVL